MIKKFSEYIVLVHHKKTSWNGKYIPGFTAHMRNECVKYNHQFLRCEDWA